VSGPLLSGLEMRRGQLYAAARRTKDISLGKCSVGERFASRNDIERKREKS
jgi:hypothetical protein